jgi:DNA-binding SARP family transcriptional activator/tetratricopeptide (TPR) repeat protein
MVHYRECESPQEEMKQTVRIEVLGELRVFAPDGELITLPASRKTKALLAYLGLTGRPQFREHLCNLLWVGPNDPRGALRWSLSRLRANLDTDTHRRIDSNRRSVGLISDSFTIDLHQVQDTLQRAHGQPPVDELRRIASLFRGDLLEGLDLLDSYRFHSWRAGQQETARHLRVEVLTALIAQVSEADEALKHAHALVSIDPLNEAAHSNVIRLLVQMQRHHDAQEQINAYRRTLEIELGEVPGDVAARLRRIVHSDTHIPRKATTKRARGPVVEVLPMVGRGDERAALTSWLTGSHDSVPMAIISGEPGSGKTRLMDEVIHNLSNTLMIRGRAYRAENTRALGPWRDALADIDGSASVLTSVAGTDSALQHRAKLFDELLALISVQSSATQALVITLDDLQWMDEASVAFMHFLIRSQPDNVVFIGTLRSEEIIDNPEMGDVLQSLRRDGAMLELVLQPLTRGEIDGICAAIDERIDGAQVFERSEGNPFLATEIARALARGETDLPSNMRQLVGARLQAVSGPSRELLPWAAALGRTFHIDVLERVTGLAPIGLVERIGELEERGILEPRRTGAYDFTHDLVRDAAYGELSAPRQRIIHRSIARSLDSWHSTTAFSAAELLRHAELGGETTIACRASVAAAQDALNVCAWVDACVIADRGLQHTATLDARSRVDMTLQLLNCRITAGSTLERRQPDHIVEMLEKTIRSGGTAQQKALALYLQSVLQYERGDARNAEQGLVAATEAGRLGDPETAARQLANSARCLLHIEGDVPKARELLGEAREALQSLDIQDVELYWAEALLARWDGDLDRSAEHLLQAIHLAGETNNHWRKSSCLAALIMVTSESGDSDRVEKLSRGGLLYGEENGEPLKSPFVEGLAALADFRRDPSATEHLDRVIEVLRTRNAKAQLSYLLAESARLYAELGRFEEAAVRATDAVQSGEFVHRVVPQTDALITLAWVCLKRGDRAGGLEALARAEKLAHSNDTVTARVMNRLRDVADALGNA